MNEPILGFDNGPGGNHRYLSNFWPCQFNINGTTYESSEQWYMVNKTTDEVDQSRIMSAVTPGEAKRIGRTVTLRPDWEDVKNAIMLFGVRAKFNQNPILASALVNTGHSYLEETNTWGDKYWGVCNGVGFNMLGITLMRVRAELSMDGWHQ